MGLHPDERWDWGRSAGSESACRRVEAEKKRGKVLAAMHWNLIGRTWAFVDNKEAVGIGLFYFYIF